MKGSLTSAVIGLALTAAFSVGSAYAQNPPPPHSSGVSSTTLAGPNVPGGCFKATVGGVRYGWPRTDSGLTTIFQSSADNGRSINVWLGSDFGYPVTNDTTNCNEGDAKFPLPYVAG